MQLCHTGFVSEDAGLQICNDTRKDISMNRRSLFAALAGAPVAVAGVAAAPAKAVTELKLTVDASALKAAVEAYMLDLGRLSLVGDSGVMPLRRSGPGVMGVAKQA